MRIRHHKASKRTGNVCVCTRARAVPIHKSWTQQKWKENRRAEERKKNEWKNVFRIKVIKVNFYYMNIEYYILFHHQPASQPASSRHQHPASPPATPFLRSGNICSYHLSKYSFSYRLNAAHCSSPYLTSSSLSSSSVAVVFDGVSTDNYPDPHEHAHSLASSDSMCVNVCVCMCLCSIVYIESFFFAQYFYVR